MRVLLIEDDSDIAANISDYLTAKGHVVDLAYDGADGLRAARQAPHDLYLLDANLPVLSGFELCRIMRETLQIDAPILFTTARGNLDDKLAGFAAGCWDYLVKPFSLAELDARMQATLLRAGDRAPLLVGTVEMDRNGHSVRIGRQAIILPRIPAIILRSLMRNHPEPVDRGSLVSEIWGDEEPDSAPLRSHISGLRRTLQTNAADVEIRLVRGLGYALAEAAAQ
ncbi:response regulator transcription factor [Maricaulis maris]|uniref:response regulator transcription factor n=1 Tax=Maricaulis maris TaxID=74318 RepID=UPI003B8E8E75